MPIIGSKTSSAGNFINAVKPKISLIGVGKNNKFGHPNEQVLQTLGNINSEIYRTDEDGEIILKINRKRKNQNRYIYQLICIILIILVNTTKKDYIKGMMDLNKRIAITISIISIILLGAIFGYIMFDNNPEVNENAMLSNENILAIENNQEISAIETSVEEEKTSPNTLIIYKTYYTKCKHYIQRYEDIDVSLVNLTEKEFKEKNRQWTIEKFSSKEIELSKEEEAFCNEHYKLRLENNVIVIYEIDEAGNETEYEQTEITTEYLTSEDILKLTAGIEVYGKENLSNTIEDYE